MHGRRSRKSDQELLGVPEEPTVVSSLCRCHCTQWRYRGNGGYNPRVVHALIVIRFVPRVVVVDSRTIWLLPTLTVSPTFITSHSRRFVTIYQLPTGLTDLARRPTLWAMLLRATPNPVSRISHLHCAFQKTRADPDLGMNSIQTNPTSFHLYQSTSGSRSRSPFDRTHLQIFLRDLCWPSSTPFIAVYTTRAFHISRLHRTITRDTQNSNTFTAIAIITPSLARTVHCEGPLSHLPTSIRH
jgi:hypothetical protein